MEEGSQVALWGLGRTAGLAAMRVQRDLRQKVLPGPPARIQAARIREVQDGVPEPRAVPHASEAQVCIMRLQRPVDNRTRRQEDPHHLDPHLREPLQPDRLLPPAPRHHEAGDDEAAVRDGAADGDHEAAGSGEEAAGLRRPAADS